MSQGVLNLSQLPTVLDQQVDIDGGSLIVGRTTPGNGQVNHAAMNQRAGQRFNAAFKSRQ